jgi:hypothetical protein
MSSSGWSDLWGIALSKRRPSDANATLLRLQAELFVNAPARDRNLIESFEAIALGFLPIVDRDTVAAVASLVAPCADTPPSILEALAVRSPEALDIVAAHAPRVPPAVFDLLLGAADGRPALAARRDLDDATIARLLVLHDDRIDAALASNPAVDPTGKPFRELVERARARAGLARILLARRDLASSDEAALYLAAGPDRRAEIRGRVAASALFQRPHLPFRLSAARVEELVATARAGDADAIEAQLAQSFGVTGTSGWRILEPERHELVALALRALGVEEEDATRMFLTLHPAMSHSVATVFSLVRVMRQVARPTALALVEAILGEPTAFARQGRHVPAMDPSGTSSVAALAQPARGRRAAEEHQRRQG